jgi:hypothetical protein
MRRLVQVAAVATLAVLASAPGAGATVTVGQAGDGSGADCTSGFDWVPANTPAPYKSYAVPGTGTITSWTTDASGTTGPELTMKVFRKIAEPATFQVVGHAGPGTLTQPGRNTFPASIRVSPGDLIGFHTDSGLPLCNLNNVLGATIFYHGGDLADGASADFLTDNDYLLNVEATFDPDNTLKLGAISRNKKKGTATIAANVPNAGTVKVSGKGVKTASSRAQSAVSVSAAGTVKLPIRAKGKQKSKLNSTGRVSVKATITYTPTGGTATTQKRKVKLQKNV